jgi:hypothetical protein
MLDAIERHGGWFHRFFGDEFRGAGELRCEEKQQRAKKSS